LRHHKYGPSDHPSQTLGGSSEVETVLRSAGRIVLFAAVALAVTATNLAPVAADDSLLAEDDKLKSLPPFVGSHNGGRCN